MSSLLYIILKMDNALQQLKCAVHFHFKNTHKLKQIFKIFIVSSSKVSIEEWQCRVSAYSMENSALK